METVLTQKIIESITQGNITQFFSYILIFVFIWIEVRGMKTELKNLNLTVSKSFAEGEKRFEFLEDSNKKIEYRLTMLESQRGQS